MLDWFVWIDCELELFGELPDLRRGAFEVQCQVCPRLCAQYDVLCDSHRLDQHKVLVAHTDSKCNRVVRRLDLAHLSIDNDLPAVGRVEAIRDAHRRRLTRAILPHDRVDRPRLYDDVDVIVGDHVAEAFSYLSEFEHSIWS